MSRTIYFALSIFILVFMACEDNKHLKEETSVEKVNTLGNFFIKTESDKIIFAPKHGEINAPLLYKDDYSDFNFNGYYRIKTQDDKLGYFRFGWINYKDSTSIMSNVNWFYKEPLLIDNFEEVTIETIKAASSQDGNLRVCTIGDSQTWWSSASKLRKKMEELNPDFYFTGSNTDIYGFPHEAEGGNSTEKVLKRIDKIPEADFYTLLIGTNDWKKDISVAEKNIKTIMNKLITKYPSSRIIYITPLPTTNTKRDQFNKALAERITAYIKGKPQLLKLSVGEKMRENADWAKDYLSQDGLHPNNKGVNFLAKEITSFIEQQTE